MKDLNWLDLLFLVIFLASTLMGAARGLARIGISMAATIFGILFASRWYAEAGSFLREYVTSQALANALGFVVVLLLFVLTGGIISFGLSKLFKWAGISWLDRLLGAIFGFLRALLISIAIVMIAMAFPRQTLPQAVIQSQIAPYVVEASRLLAALTPPDLKDSFRRNYDEVQKIWNKP